MYKHEAKKNNSLIFEKSPYLLQHAYNPVDWHPWGKEAFKKARMEDKPIFLSIGYSTCHWCHVMEKESFEDPEVASLINDAFVSIKVDREERPDIDKVYMNFCQMLTGSGGWPLTIIMTPDKKPFFAATYIPKRDKYGRTGMLNLIPRIKELWLNKRPDIIQSSENIFGQFLKLDTVGPGKELKESVFDLAFDHLSRLYDAGNGGFGSFPKFPTMHHLFFLLRYHKRSNNEYALEIVEKTIQSMRAGGIWDHVGFGFHRYSTDEKWTIPHFEKMLYDQALITISCIETYQATKNETYKEIAEEIITYVLRDMASAKGGFYSAEDADSEGVEGKFYAWSKKEIEEIFPKQEADIIADVFNSEAAKLETGGSVLFIDKPLKDTASKYGLDPEYLRQFIKIGIKKLYAEREKRTHPFKDDKILTDWNGLMITALSMAARVLGNKYYLEAAVSAADFIINNLITKNCCLMHRYRDSQSAIDANLDDYAFFIMGLIELYQAAFDIKYLKTAIKLNKKLLEDFWDKKSGGFYFTRIESELSDFRQKDAYDGALPSGNSIALLNLVKLGRITSDAGLEDKAYDIVKFFAASIEKSPESYTQFLSSFDFLSGPSFEIVIVSKEKSWQTEKIIKKINSVFSPNKVLLFKASGIKEQEITSIAPYSKDMKMIDGKPTIYVCTENACKSPTNSADEAIKFIL